MNGAVTWMFAVLILGAIGWGIIVGVLRVRGMTPEQRRDRYLALQAKKVKGPAGRPISQVAARGIGVLACPVCGGAAFKARRSRKARAGVVAATVTMPVLGAAAFAGTRKTRVECTTCGTVYRRG